jgi:4-diphosphocytidyl-2-C-methyl-D-erythritol kinase
MKTSSLSTRRYPLSLKAPAKINWFLRILNKRDDDYHNISSFMQCVSIYDTLHFEPADTVELNGNLDIPPENNLVYKTALLLKEYASYKGGAKISLQKSIPVSAGLGGGSSDAAYTLQGLNKLWGLGLDGEELSTIGLEIGSDIPFFLNSSPALVEGRGEQITHLDLDISSMVLLLVKPPVDVSTAWAYSLFDQFRPAELTKKHIDIKLFCHAFVKNDFVSLNTMLINDFENVVFEEYPVIEKIKKRMLENGALVSSMSGSGPTVFGVFESKKAARSVASMMGADHWSSVTETMV